MKYHDGSIIKLGDIVYVPVPEGKEKAYVVMLGDTYEHLNIDEQFLSWVINDKVLGSASIIIEWCNNNPFAHNDPKYSPVGNYMFTVVDEFIEKIT